MFYKIKEDTKNNASISESLRLSKVKISHILFMAHGVGIKATEAPKLIFDIFVQDEYNNNKNIVTGVPASVFGEYADMLGGVGFNSITDIYFLIPVGTLDLSDKDLMIEMKTTSALAANDFVYSLYGVRLDDRLPVLEYQYRAMPVDGVTIPNCLALYDVSTAYNSSVISVITMSDGSQINIPHKMAFALAQCTQKLETQNAYGIVFQDKDMEGGRKIKVEPSASFNALVLQYSAKLNG